jgi:predicted nicotinamide N-methyase
VSATHDLASLEASLARRFRVVETPVHVLNRSLSILHPASAEDLIDEKDFERDERLPYWAELWPSARVLGESLLRMRSEGRSLLELGCGSGLVSTCAALAGFSVTVSDYYDDAMLFARVNARRNAAPDPGTVLIDWRNLPKDLPRFDLVVASDVLYERTYGPVVAQAIAATLARDGVAYVADPGRVARDTFIRALSPIGLKVAERTSVPFRDGTVSQTITIFEIRVSAERST